MMIQLAAVRKFEKMDHLQGGVKMAQAGGLTRTEL